jgi:hypothetical protein
MVGNTLLPAASADGEPTPFFMLLVIDRDSPVILDEVFSRAHEYWRGLYEGFGYIEPRFIDAKS